MNLEFTPRKKLCIHPHFPQIFIFARCRNTVLQKRHHIQIKASQITSCMTLGKFLNFSEPHFFICKMGRPVPTCLIGLRRSDTMHDPRRARSKRKALAKRSAQKGGNHPHQQTTTPRPRTDEPRSLTAGKSPGLPGTSSSPPAKSPAESASDSHRPSSPSTSLRPAFRTDAGGPRPAHPEQGNPLAQLPLPPPPPTRARTGRSAGTSAAAGPRRGRRLEPAPPPPRGLSPRPPGGGGRGPGPEGRASSQARAAGQARPSFTCSPGRAGAGADRRSRPVLLAAAARGPREAGQERRKPQAGRRRRPEKELGRRLRG